MNSYKVLIILTLIFYIITYCNGGLQDPSTSNLKTENNVKVDLTRMNLYSDTLKGLGYPNTSDSGTTTNPEDPTTSNLDTEIDKDPTTSKLDTETDKDPSTSNLKTENDVKEYMLNFYKDYIVCKDILTKIGFQHDFGFYNLSFILQFIKDNRGKDKQFLESFLNKINISTHFIEEISSEIDERISKIINVDEFIYKYDIANTIEKYLNSNVPKKIKESKKSDISANATYNISIEDQPKIKIARFIYRFYKDSTEVDFSSKETFFASRPFCYYYLMIKQDDTPVDEVYSKIMDFSNYAENRELIATFETNEENKKRIKNCQDSIKAFKWGRMYKYTFDDSNIFKSIMTSMYLNIARGVPVVKTAIEEMDDYQKNYFKYMISYSAHHNKVYSNFTIDSLCQNHMFEEMLNIKNPPKELTINEGGEK